MEGDLGGRDDEVHHVIDVLASAILLFLVSVPGWAGEIEGGVMWVVSPHFYGLPIRSLFEGVWLRVGWDPGRKEE